MAAGTWDSNSRSVKTATFNTVEARYVCVNILEAVGNYGSIAEFNVYQSTGTLVDKTKIDIVLEQIADKKDMSAVINNLYEKGLELKGQEFITVETIDNYIEEVETTVEGLSDLVIATAEAKEYGATEELNHHYLRRLAKKGEEILNEGTGSTSEIIELVTEINANFDILPSLNEAVSAAKEKVTENPNDERFIYLNELIEKAESNHGYGLPAGVLELVIQDINTALTKLENPVTYYSIQSGEVWIDNNGSQISANGGGTIKVGDTYYWYGEDNRLSYDLRTGVTCYSSKDLYNWKYEGIALSVFDMPADFYTDALSDLNESIEISGTKGRIERPKVIYNATTGKYIMWMHLEKYGGYGLASAGVAISDAPQGPFTFLHYGRPVMDTTLTVNGEERTVSNQTYRDMNLFIDTGNDKNNDGADDAYAIYSSEENNTLYIVRLNYDYTWVDISEEDALVAPRLKKDYKGFLIPEDMQVPSLTDKQLYAYVEGEEDAIVNPDGVWTRHHRENQREAPAPFKYNDNYYIITSAATGWNANQASYYMGDHILGPYTNMGDPCVGDTNHTTFTSQSTAVITIDQEKGHYVYMGDRWKNGDYSNGDVKNSPYVWLPIEFDEEGKLAIRWYDQWEYSILDIMGKTIRINCPKVVTVGAVPQLPQEAEILDNDTVLYTTPIQWSIDSEQFSKPGIVKVEGILPAYGDKIVNATICVIPDGTIYFVNAGGAATEDYNTMVEAMENTLMNQDSIDQEYDPRNGKTWGYVGNSGAAGSDTGDIFTSLRYLKGDSGDDLTYNFEVSSGNYAVYVGLYDPWYQWSNGNRKADIIIDGEVKKEDYVFTSEYDTFAYRDINVTDGNLELTIHRSASAPDSNSDPQISWIMIANQGIEQDDIIIKLRNSDGEVISNLIPGETVIAEVSTKEDIEEGSIIVALFDEKNTMQEYSVKFLSQVNSGEYPEITLPEKINGYKIKIMVWDSLEGMVPLTEPKVITNH